MVVVEIISGGNKQDTRFIANRWRGFDHGPRLLHAVTRHNQTKSQLQSIANCDYNLVAVSQKRQVKVLNAGVSLDDKTGNIVQFSAGKTYKPGEAAPKGSKVLPYSALYNAPKAGLGGLNTGANGYQGKF
jgi:hypothetical protein